MRGFFVVVSLVICVAWVAAEQNSSTARKASTVERVQPLVLTDAIPMEGVKGRFDQVGYGRGRVFVAALGSNAYFGKEGQGFDRFYLAVPARGGQPAEMRVYAVQD